MPTPESAAFLAKKPTVPPTFDGVDYDDNRRLKQAQDAIVREQWVRCMMARLVREELGKCYRREGINHLLNCGKLRGMFTSMRPSRLVVYRVSVGPPAACLLSCCGPSSSLSIGYPDILHHMTAMMKPPHMANRTTTRLSSSRTIPRTAARRQGQGIPLPATELRPEGLQIRLRRHSQPVAGSTDVYGVASVDLDVGLKSGGTGQALPSPDLAGRSC